jgi:hemerythrin superfamily protein
MDAITLLKNQHREVEELFERFEALGDGGGSERKAIVAAIAKNLEAHAQIEERLFYPEGREADEETTLEAYEEHAVVRDLLKKIAKTRINDESLAAKMTVLKEIVQHHVDEEENEYFPECEALLGDERLEELGMEMEDLFQKLVGGRKTRRKRVSQKRGGKKRRKAA